MSDRRSSWLVVVALVASGLVTVGCATRLGGPGGPDEAAPSVTASTYPFPATWAGPSDLACYERQPRLGRDVFLVGGADPAAAGGGTGDLAKASQNPVADLITLPFQNNTYFGVGPDDKVQNILNIQPVVPIPLGRSWNLISRAILPVVWQEEEIFPDVTTQMGLGDLTYTAFLSPRKASKLIWGAGPVLLLPTATSDDLGTEKWGAGPSVVVLTMPGQWVIGALANQIWSFAGADDRADVNQLLVQPFVNYNMPGGWFFTSAPILTANWDAPSGEEWTIPLGGGFGRVFKIAGRQPVSLSLAAYYNVERPQNAADGSIRLQFILLFPKK